MEVANPPAQTIARLHAILDLQERARADRFHFDTDRETYIVAHALARSALSSSGGLQPQAWRFVSNRFGKPEIDPALGRPDLRFSISHTQGLVACVVGLRNDLGIDAETCDRTASALEIAERYFTPQEIALLNSVARGERHDAFLRLWTLKESYLKAIGKGLVCPLDSIAFSLDPIAITFRTDSGDDPANWQFIQQHPTPRHLLSIALRRPSTLPTTFITHIATYHEIINTAG